MFENNASDTSVAERDSLSFCLIHTHSAILMAKRICGSCIGAGWPTFLSFFTPFRGGGRWIDCTVRPILTKRGRKAFGEKCL